MDDMPKTRAMDPQEHNGLSGFDPAELLRQGAGDDTFTENRPGGFIPPSLEELSGIFPRFEILELIGKGGMGAVYKVRQPELDRVVALKILPPAIGLSPAFANRFTREAKALAKLSHPGIVTIHESGQEGGLYYILMEFIDGVNLRQLLDNGRISPREAMAIVPQICDALQFAHDQGIVHRDIKPENILLDRLGRVKVADFGIAKLIGNNDPAATSSHSFEATLTDGGKTMGTPQYMAPEQIDSPAEVDHRADIFALGVVFYQMLTGELPEKNLQPPSRKISLDVRLDEIVLRALENDPALRYSNVTEMKTRIEGMDSTSQVATSSWNLNYRSSREIFGLPLLHVTTGTDPETGKERHAKGILAVGGKATGVIAVGGRAYGGIAFGGIAAGMIAFGGISIGVISWGGIALALYLALGGLAAGWATIGGTTLGVYSYGSSPHGIHTLGPANEDPQAVEFFMPWAHTLMTNIGGIMFLAMATVFLLAFGLPMAIANRKSTAPKPIGKYLVWSTLGLAIIAFTVGLQGPSIWHKHVEAPMPPYTSIQPQESRPTDTVKTAPLPRSGKTALPSAEQLVAPPILRAMNWQDQEKDQSGKRWLPSGELDESNIKLPGFVGIDVSKMTVAEENPRFLCLWFSHPLFDRHSIANIRLFEKDGKTPLEIPTGNQATDSIASSPEHENTGWITATRCVGTKTDFPGEAVVKLRYSIGPWKSTVEIPADFNGTMALSGTAFTTSPGQNANGNAFIQITDSTHPELNDEQIDIVAISKAGKTIESEGIQVSGSSGAYTKRITIKIPLRDVKLFKCRTRPIREISQPVTLRQDDATLEYVTAKNLPADNRLEVRKVVPQGSPNSEAMPYIRIDEAGTESVETIHLSNEVIVWGDLVERNFVKENDDGVFLEIGLNELGTNRMRNATQPTDEQMRLAILIDGKIKNAPVVHQGPLGRNFQITGFKTQNEAVELIKSFPQGKIELKAMPAILWLVGIDNGNYEQCYDGISPIFEPTITKDQWIETLQTARKPFGAFTGNRRIIDLQERKSIAGAPDGVYRVVEIVSEYQNKNQSKKVAIETVTLVKEGEEWRVAAYFIQ